MKGNAINYSTISLLWIGVERMSKKDCYTKTSADIEPQIKISADKTIITLSIHNGLNLTLKKDADRDCFVGEIPVTELLDIFKDRIDSLKDSAKGALIGAGVGAVCGGPIGMLGGIFGAIGNLLKENYIEEDNKKAEIFNYTVAKLSQKYGLHLRKRNSSHSDFTVEVDANSVYDLI